MERKISSIDELGKPEFHGEDNVYTSYVTYLSNLKLNLYNKLPGFCRKRILADEDG